jgi:hypothetical protein
MIYLLTYIVLASIQFFSTAKMEKQLADYFVENHVGVGILDRESNRQIISVAASGFGMACLAISADRGYIAEAEAIQRINEIFDRTLEANPEKNKGWLYHYTDTEGNPAFGGEVSSIDSALFYLGARASAEILGDKEFEDKVNDKIRKVDTSLMMNGKLFLHGFHWIDGEPAYLPTCWDHYSEGVLIYSLFNKPYDPVEVHYDLPLFVYYYPLCFYNEPEMISSLQKAVKYQQEHYGYWGKTACDGPNGYACNEEDVVSPLSVWAVGGYVTGAEEMLRRIPVSRDTPAYHWKNGWVANDRVGIDLGSCLMLRNKKAPEKISGGLRTITRLRSLRPQAGHPADREFPQ